MRCNTSIIIFSFFAAMPAYNTFQDVLAIKCLCFHADNDKKKLPTHQAQILLYNSQNGSLLAVSLVFV